MESKQKREQERAAAAAAAASKASSTTSNNNNNNRHNNNNNNSPPQSAAIPASPFIPHLPPPLHPGLNRFPFITPHASPSPRAAADTSALGPRAEDADEDEEEALSYETRLLMNADSTGDPDSPIDGEENDIQVD